MRLAYLLLGEAVQFPELASNIASCESLTGCWPVRILLFLISALLLLLVIIIRLLIILGVLCRTFCLLFLLRCCDPIVRLLLVLLRRILAALLLLDLDRLGNLSVALRVQSIEELLGCLAKLGDLHFESLSLHWVL